MGQHLACETQHHQGLRKQERRVNVITRGSDCEPGAVEATGHIHKRLLRETRKRHVRVPPGYISQFVEKGGQENSGFGSGLVEDRTDRVWVEGLPPFSSSCPANRNIIAR